MGERIAVLERYMRVTSWYDAMRELPKTNNDVLTCDSQGNLRIMRIVETSENKKIWIMPDSNLMADLDAIEYWSKLPPAPMVSGKLF